MRDVFALEPETVISVDNSYLQSYPHLIDYFASREVLNAGDFVCGAHMVYGWMPTILKLRIPGGLSDLESAASILNIARTTKQLSDQEIQVLVSITNNSLVGASKLLHFVAPAVFPIWDSKVYKFVHEKDAYSDRMKKIEDYREFVALLNELSRRPSFKKLHDSVQKKLGYQISGLRALELVMFLNTPRIK